MTGCAGPTTVMAVNGNGARLAGNMPRITYEQEEEYRRLKGQNEAIDTLMARLTAYDAAMRVIVRHDLLKELADEMRASDPAAQS